LGGKAFSNFSVEEMKPILRAQEDVWFYSFDISNFYHSFIIPEEMRKEVPTIYWWKKVSGDVVFVGGFEVYIWIVDLSCCIWGVGKRNF